MVPCLQSHLHSLQLKTPGKRKNLVSKFVLVFARSVLQNCENEETATFVDGSPVKRKQLPRDKISSRMFDKNSGLFPEGGSANAG